MQETITNLSPVRTSDSIGKLSLSLSKAQLEFEKAVKSSENPFFKSRYADLATIINATKEYLCKNELAVMQFPSGDQNSVSITTRLCHSSGEWLESTISGKPPKGDAQSQGSMITYLRRYSLAAICGLSQEDDDGNSLQHQFITKEQSKVIDIKSQSNPEVRDGILKTFGSFDKIPADKFKTIMARL